jgi:hypothetical protein
MEANVDLASTFSAMPNASRLNGLSEAWHWATAPGFDFAAALSSDGKHAFQCYALDSYDEDLVAAVLSFAREHGDEAIAPPERPLVVVEGFAHPGYRFDTVVAFGPAVHQYHDENPDLQRATRAVQPAYRCEFAGDETEQDARYRYIRASGVRPTTLNREPHPYLKMRHRTDSGRVVPERGFAAPKLLVNELRALENSPDRFVELETYRNEVWRVEWEDGSRVVTGASGEPRRFGLDELLEFVKDSLYGPNLDAGTGQFPSGA